MFEIQLQILPLQANEQYPQLHFLTLQLRFVMSQPNGKRIVLALCMGTCWERSHSVMTFVKLNNGKSEANNTIFQCKCTCLCMN